MRIANHSLTRKAPFSTRDHRELESNVTGASHLHFGKHNSQIPSTDAGTYTERNPLARHSTFFKKHDSQITSMEPEM
jgi:hypothetical protein